MNDATHAALEAYIKDVAARMNLRDWTIYLSRQIDDAGHYRAQITLYRERDEAEVQLAEPWFGRSPEEQRYTVVHELVHVVTTRLVRVVSRYVEQVGGELVNYLGKEHDEEEEIVVDRFARIIAPSMPLPPNTKTITAEVRYAGSAGDATIARSDMTHEPNAYTDFTEAVIVQNSLVYCLKCHQPVVPNAPGTLRDSGCGGWYHTKCVLSPVANRS